MADHAALSDTLRQALYAQPQGTLCVAYSGGPDSTALLHALAQMPEARARGLRAIHIDHRLHADSARWAAHCRAFCVTLGIACEVQIVSVDRGGGIGLEAAARHARYAAFAAHLHAGERLLFGHHQDDQAETVLMKLLRGAGPEGLAGMHEQRPLGQGMAWRTLLGLPRQVLRDYTAAHDLPCIHDPSNDDRQFARNQLRHEIMPRLRTHWPQAAVSITHSALLCRKAAARLQDEWLAAYEVLRDDASNSLDARGWLALPAALREPLLAHWLHVQGLSAPTTAQRQQIERQCGARDGQLPCIRWSGTEVHVWKHRLWALPARTPAAWSTPVAWQGESLLLPGGGRLSLRPSAQLARTLTVRPRAGGERIKPAGDRHTRELRALFQSGAIPPWQRAGCPLIYEGETLIAVADRWLSQRAYVIFDQAAAYPYWQP